MAQLFVSHSSVDNDFALRLRECLGGLGYESVFLDFDANDGLVPGQAWRDLLFANIDASDAVLLVTTPASNDSKWCHAELALARWLRKPLLSLMLDGSPPHELTADIQGIQLSSRKIDADRVRAALVALGLDHTARWDALRSPYPGLRAFDESYAAVFFGREAMVADLQRLLAPPGRSRHGAVVALLGPSGSGKSSLVRAGLVPALRASPDWLVCNPWTPSDTPLAELALALSHTAKQHHADLDPDQCDVLLRTRGGMADYVRALCADERATADAKVLVVIDQAEELVTVTPEPSAKEFLTTLATSCGADSPLRVVMTARTDLWDKVSSHVSQYGIPLRSGVLHLRPLTRTELVSIIREPARRSHLLLEPGLVERMVEETGSGEALPLLAFTLARMTTATNAGQLTLAGYEAIGGVHGAIASQASEVAARWTEAEVAQALVHLVGIAGTEPFGRLARAADIPVRHREILDELVEARLVISSEGGHDQLYSAAHEALFRAWRPLVDLIEVRKDAIRLRGRLERRAADWQSSGSTKAGLLSASEVEQTREWKENNPDLLNVEIASYLDASTRHARRGKILRVAVGAVVACLALALVLVLVHNARRDRHRTAQLFASIADRESEQDPVAAAIAVIEGLELEPDNDALKREARSLLESPYRDIVHDETPGGDGVDIFYAGGEVVAEVDPHGTTLWDTSGSRVHELPKTYAIAVRGDGEILVTSASLREPLAVYALSRTGPEELSALTSTTSASDTAGFFEFGAFSPDGSKFARFFFEERERGERLFSRIQLWDMHDPAAPTLLNEVRLADGLNSAAPLNDGRVLFSGDRALSSWNALGNGAVETIVRKRWTFQRHLDVDVLGGLVLLNLGSGLDLVDGQNGQSVLRIDRIGKSRVGEFESMRSDGRMFVAFDGGGRGYVFDADDGSVLLELEGGTGVVDSRFTASGMIVTLTQDGTMRLWDPEPAPVRGDLTDALCETFGDRMDLGSWNVAMGETKFEPPC